MIYSQWKEYSSRPIKKDTIVWAIIVPKIFRRDSVCEPRFPKVTCSEWAGNQLIVSMEQKCSFIKFYAASKLEK